MSKRLIESTTLESQLAYLQCIHGKAMCQRCDDCATLKLDESRAGNLLKRLLEWAEFTGGWEAPVWKDAKDFLNPEQNEQNDEE